MKPLVIALASLLGIASSVNAQINIFSGFNNQPVGRITSDISDNLNICNTYGIGGSAYSTYSIYSTMGINGSQSSSWGAYNSYSNKPPYFYFKGEKYYITANPSLNPAVHPDSLRAYVCK